jgi:hypothetical protein
MKVSLSETYLAYGGDQGVCWYFQLVEPTNGNGSSH